MKKRGDWPFQSPGRGRLSADERLRVEGLLEHVVYRLEGKGSDRFVSFSSMLRRGVTMETVASALMLRRGGKARMYFEDAVSMLGQIARRINSYLLPRIVALRLDLDRQWRSWNGNAPDKAGTRRLVDAFARCHDALFAEVGFLDVRERVKIWPRASGHPADLSGRDEMFFPERGMAAEEATQGSRAAALRNHRREMRTTGFARKVAALTACFERLADDALSGVASARTAGRSPDWQMLVEVLQSFTTLAYCEFSDMDLYFRDDSDPADVRRGRPGGVLALLGNREGEPGRRPEHGRERAKGDARRRVRLLSPRTRRARAAHRHARGFRGRAPRPHEPHQQEKVSLKRVKRLFHLRAVFIEPVPTPY